MNGLRSDLESDMKQIAGAFSPFFMFFAPEAASFFNQGASPELFMNPSNMHHDQRYYRRNEPSQ